VRQAEVTAAKTMISRCEAQFGLCPARLAGDSAYGSAAMLQWLVHERGIEPHIRECQFNCVRAFHGGL